ncbi:phospholipase A [Ramlibacter sp.]|uniref:phospholipase A n=1 Tax=Ramlibacter sp. TaxID=1917967 RepID=UPI0035B0057E
MQTAFTPLRALAATLPLLATTAWSQPAWQACAAIGDAASRLACFDRWAESQRSAVAGQPVAPSHAPAPLPAAPPPAAAVAARAVQEAARGLRLTSEEGCRDTAYSELSRYWELERGAGCGTFGIRGFRPIEMAVVTADAINRQPTSGNPENNATSATDYRITEARLQLSVRTKIAEGLLTRGSDERHDSLWFAYSQQSYWQIFTPQLSRPFRSTDHEPEFIYVLPLQSADPGRWRLRYGGLGLVHQSNGQSLPLSRSWNRAYVMAGAERGPWQLHAKVWRRAAEGGGDDNPGISDYVGRAELRGVWHASRRHLLSATVRHSLDRPGRGSVRLEWFRALADDGDGPVGGLQLHTQLFTGYGDSLLDYNRRRTVLSVGLSLVEW